MAHGIGGTRDSSLEPFAEAFAGAGLDALLFDYRCFGDSTGEPRQLAWPPRHRADYKAAVAHARGLNGVDPERIVLWGTSWSGGHVVHVAAADPRIAALISQNPDLNGTRTLVEVMRYSSLGQMNRLTAAGVKDLVSRRRGGEPHLIPIVGPPGTLAAMSSEDADEGYHSIAGPTWRNEITAGAASFEPLNRAVDKIAAVECPMLIQIVDADTVAPPGAARAAAWKARGRVQMHEYPCGHFDIYLGEWRERAIVDQLRFLSRVLGAGGAEATEEPEPERVAEPS